jgi:hypothetical protein
VSYTPGPWTVTIDESPARGPVAYVNGPPIYDTAFEPDDARLIAAAPDLLEALQEVRDYMREGRGGFWDRVDVAIAKATEQSHPVPTAAPPPSADEPRTTSPQSKQTPRRP